MMEWISKLPTLVLHLDIGGAGFGFEPLSGLGFGIEDIGITESMGCILGCPIPAIVSFSQRHIFHLLIALGNTGL